MIQTEGPTQHPLGPPSSGFRNIKPKTRAERLAMRDKVALEKGRLAQRVGHEARMYQANLNPAGVGLTELPQDGAGFLSDADRFHTDTSGEEYLKRQAAIERSHQIRNAGREEQIERERRRWEALEEAKAAEEARWQRAREDPEQGRKNVSAVPYDLVTLKYNDDPSGERLRHDDDLTKYRAAARANNITRHGDTRAGYNILTGEARPPLQEAPRPPTPDALRVYDHRGTSRGSASRRK
mmetsp:Transcript_12432/g.17304  ORF Transcript_12432/g.17304 Transcript_12432/m.17304 type:complete len:239 (+) Transcript_12432:47-763(+)